MKKLYILTGFLGAGKTTFLKQTFKMFSDKKVAVIVNEYGAVGVDGKILSDEGIENIEITGGSIFCVCKKDKFLEALNLAYKTDCEIIIVESSGLADPLSTDEMLLQYKKIYGNELVCAGIVCIIDCKNFHKVLSTAVSVENQVKAADLFVLNKVDLVDNSQLNFIENKIIEINPIAKIIKTSFCNVDVSDIYSINHTEKIGGSSKKDLLNSKIVYEFDKIVSDDELMEFLNKINPKAYRIKGYVKTTANCFSIECVMGEITSKQPIAYDGKSYLVILSHANENIRKML